MAQVPYQPFATAEPQAGGEKIAVSTPGAAFGENVGAALQQLGSTGEQVGNELFGRAMALQDLKNENDARAAQSEYAEKASLLHAQFGSQLGKDANDQSLQAYIKAQNDLRNQIRGTLQTAYAQRYYDRDTLPFMQRNIFSAAGHAADQTKQYTVQTLEAVKYNAAKSFVNPADDAEFADKVTRTKASNVDIAHATGKSQEFLDAQNAKDLAGLWENRIKTLALTDPQAALTMLDTHEGDLGERYKQTVVNVRAQNRSIGTTKLVESIFSFDKSVEQMEAEIKEKSAALAHGDPQFEVDAVHRLKDKIYSDNFLKRQQDNQLTQKLYEGIMSLPPGAGERELRAVPGMNDVIQALPKKQQAMLGNTITAALRSRDAKDSQEEITRLESLRVFDREKFLEEDLAGNRLLSEPTKRMFIDKRGALLNNPREDPMYATALSALRRQRPEEMKAAGVFFRPPAGADSTDYDHFTGALIQAIDAYREDNHKAPDIDTIVNKIGPTLLRKDEQHTGLFGIYGGPFGSDRPHFDVDVAKVNKWWADNPGFAEEFRSRSGADATPEQIYRAYIRQQFINLYKKEKADGGPTK